MMVDGRGWRKPTSMIFLVWLILAGAATPAADDPPRHWQYVFVPQQLPRPVAISRFCDGRIAYFWGHLDACGEFIKDPPKEPAAHGLTGGFEPPATLGAAAKPREDVY